MMRNNFRHTRWLVLALILAAALSGCYRSAGGSLEPTPSNQNVTQIANNTPIPMPTLTAILEETEEVIEPTAEEITALPSPIPASPTDEIDTAVPTVEEAFPDGQGGFAGPTPTRTAVQVAIAPSFTPVPPTQVLIVPTAAVSLPTPIPTQLPTQIPTQIAALGPTATFTSVPYNPPLPSATYTPFVPPQEAVPLGERPTETLAPGGVDGQGGPVAVAQLPTNTLTVNQVTATAIIAGATMTAAAIQGTIMPTQQVIQGQPTPFPPGVTPLATIAVGPTVAPGQCSTHLISPGETLSRIALQYNVTSQQIAQSNNIVNPDLILAGNTLVIPCPLPATPVTPTAAPGAIGATTTNTSGPFNYIVEPGDNLYRISLRYGVSMAALMQANGLTPATINMIYAGQQLYIPAAAVPAQTGVTPLPTATLQPTG